MEIHLDNLTLFYFQVLISDEPMGHYIWRSGQSGDHVSGRVGVRPLGLRHTALPLVLHRSGQPGRVFRHYRVQALPLDQEENP